MNSENKNNGDNPAKEPPLKNYQEQPEANKELQQAIENIPVKDYSDYEITIETKEHYEDALFSDDDSLDEALTATQPAVEKLQPKEEKNETASQEKTVSIDYSSFLPKASISGDFSVAGDTSPQIAQLKLTEASLNGSILEAETPATTIESPTHEPPQAQPSQKDEEDIGKANAKPHEKLLHWGKNKLSKNKTQLDEYLGRSLPERSLPLEFKFSALKPKKEIDHLASNYEINKLISNKGRQLHSLLKQADEDLATIVKCQLTNKARLQLLDSYTPHLCEKIRSIKGTQGKKPPYPYDEKRTVSAEHAQNVVRHLITGYKQVYSSIYASANHLYAPQRKTANRVGFRIIDLLCLEQNLCNSLHKPIPPGMPKTFNKLFHALARYEPETIEDPQDSLALEKPSSIKELFIRYQTLLSFDLMTLSPTLYKVLNQYLAHNQGKLELLSPKDWNTPPIFTGKTWMVSHDNNDKPVLATAANIDRFTAVFIRVDVFFNQVKADYSECLQLLGNDTPVHSSEPLQAITIQNSLTLLCELNRYINMIENEKQPQSYSSFQAWPCKTYTGFTTSYAWLDHYYAKLNQPIRKKGDPAPTLPKLPAAGTTQWLCAMEDEKRLYLQTSEKKGTPPLDVGWLLLIANSTEENGEELQVTRITRIERKPNNTLNLVVDKIGNASINTIISFAPETKTPAIITCSGESRLLIANHAVRFCSGMSLETMLPNRSSAAMKVKGLKALSQQIQVLELE